VLAQLSGLVADVVAEHGRGAGVGAQQRGEHAHKRGLSGAVGSEQPDDLPAGHGQVDAVERAHVADVLTTLLTWIAGSPFTVNVQTRR